MPEIDPLGAHQAEQLFSLKEWMVAISSKLDRMETKLDSKADVVHVQALENRLMVVEREVVKAQAEATYIMPQYNRMLEDVGELKQQAASMEGIETYKRWLVGSAFVSVCAVVTSIVAVVRI